MHQPDICHMYVYWYSCVCILDKVMPSLSLYIDTIVAIVMLGLSGDDPTFGGCDIQWWLMVTIGDFWWQLQDIICM